MSCKAHVGEPGDVLQAFGRQRQRERLAEVGAAARRQLLENAVGMGLELPAPGIAHRARRHRRKHRGALGHVRVAVLAHHVVAHQGVHQPGRLVRGEHVDAFFLREDIVAPGEHGRAELRHERDRRLAPHPREIRIGIGPERGHVDVEMRGVGHGGGSPVALVDIVIAGLDPAIHLLREILAKRMGTRVKPAYDGWCLRPQIVR